MKKIIYSWRNAILEDEVQKLRSRTDILPFDYTDPSRPLIGDVQFSRRPMITHPTTKVMSNNPDNRNFSVDMKPNKPKEYDQIPSWMCHFDK